jgi:hypothetical protein
MFICLLSAINILQHRCSIVYVLTASLNKGYTNWYTLLLRTSFIWRISQNWNSSVLYEKRERETVPVFESFVLFHSKAFLKKTKTKYKNSSTNQNPDPPKTKHATENIQTKEKRQHRWQNCCPKVTPLFRHEQNCAVLTKLAN